MIISIQLLLMIDRQTDRQADSVPGKEGTYKQKMKEKKEYNSFLAQCKSVGCFYGQQKDRSPS